MGLLWKKDFSTVGVDCFQDWSVSVGLFYPSQCCDFFNFTIWDIAAKPFSDVQNHAISVARDYTDIEVVDDVSIYNGTETYFSLQGKTSQGK